VQHNDNCRNTKSTYLLPLYKEKQGRKMYPAIYSRGRIRSAVIKKEKSILLGSTLNEQAAGLTSVFYCSRAKIGEEFEGENFCSLA